MSPVPGQGFEGIDLTLGVRDQRRTELLGELPGAVFQVQDVNYLSCQNFEAAELFVTDPAGFAGTGAQRAQDKPVIRYQRYGRVKPDPATPAVNVGVAAVPGVKGGVFENGR